MSLNISKDDGVLAEGAWPSSASAGDFVPFVFVISDLSLAELADFRPATTYSLMIVEFFR